MRDLVLGSDNDLWWNWSVAELDSNRFSKAFGSRVPRSCKKRSRRVGESISTRATGKN